MPGDSVGNAPFAVLPFCALFLISMHCLGFTGDWRVLTYILPSDFPLVSMLFVAFDVHLVSKRFHFILCSGISVMMLSVLHYSRCYQQLNLGRRQG